MEVKINYLKILKKIRAEVSYQKTDLIALQFVQLTHFICIQIVI